MKKKIFVYMIAFINISLLILLFINIFSKKFLWFKIHITLTVEDIFKTIFILPIITLIILKKIDKEFYYKYFKIYLLLFVIIYLINCCVSILQINNYLITEDEVYIKFKIILILLSIIFLSIIVYNFYTGNKGNNIFLFFFIILYQFVSFYISKNYLNYKIYFISGNFNLSVLLHWFFYPIFVIPGYLFIEENKIKINFKINIWALIIFILFKTLFYLVVYYITKAKFDFDFILLFFELLGNIIFVAIIEEFIFRVYLFEYMLKVFKNNMISIVFNALIFIFYHSQYFFSERVGIRPIIDFFCIGLLSTLIYSKFRSYGTNILIHGLNNALASSISWSIRLYF